MKTKQPTVLAIFAHPDDADFSSAGTIAKWASEGKEIYYILATLGDKGSSDPQITSEKLAQIRLVEQKEAAKVLGVREVIFLGERDGELENSQTLREKIVKVIRQYRPEIVVTFDPTVYIRKSSWDGYDYISHSDHRVMGTAVLDAVYPSARDYLYFHSHRHEGLQPHKVSDIYLANPEKPNTWVDISLTLDLKIRALCQHRSQVGGEIGEAERLAEFRKMIERSASRAGKYKDIQFAESFRHLRIRT
ncbi:MAG: PIG-L deacetylase family protein [Patescibacteria group bacterium]